MPFAIIRCQKLSSGAVVAAERHNLRKSETHSNVDIDTSKSHLNKVLIGSSDFRAEVVRQVDELQASQKRKIRKDAPRALEYVVTASPEAFKTPPKGFVPHEYFKAALRFLQARHGVSRVVSAVVHLDESTPHLHVVVVPVKDGKLTAKSYMAREALRKLQDDFGRLGQGFGLQRGTEGSKRTHMPVSEYKVKAEAEKAALASEIKALRETATAVPPTITVPEPKIFQSKADYGREVSAAWSAQIAPHWKAMKAKADGYDRAVTEARTAKAELATAVKRERQAQVSLQTVAERLRQTEAELTEARTQIRILDFILGRVIDFAEAVAQKGSDALLRLLHAAKREATEERSEKKGRSR